MLSRIEQVNRSNPCAALKVNKLYAVPVLLSGVTTLVLSKKEVNILEVYYRGIIRMLQKLPKSTPVPLIYFFAGALPLEAIIHKMQLSFFMMICHLSEDPLNAHAKFILKKSKKSISSWFQQIQQICSLYGIIDPMRLLSNPPTKLAFKNEVKLKVLQYWQDKLRNVAAMQISVRHMHLN